MRNWLASCVFGLALGALPSGAAQAETGCTPQRPQIGTVYLSRPGMVRVYRDGRDLTAGNGGAICAGDLIPASQMSGTIEVADGDNIPIAAGKETLVPERRHWIVRLLQSVVGRRRLFAVPHPAGSPMGDGEIGFPLIGVDRGSARLGMTHRILVIPVNAMPREAVIELYRPDSKAPQRVRIEPGTRQAVFAGVRPAKGKWKVVIDAGPRVVGGFEMLERPFLTLPDQITRGDALSQRETVLVHACLEPVENGLEAYNRLGELRGLSSRDLTIILDWQKPKRVLSCASP